MISPKLMDSLNGLALRGLFYLAFYLVVTFVVTGAHFKDAVICMLVIIAHRTYFPHIVVMQEVRKGP